MYPVEDFYINPNLLLFEYTFNTKVYYEPLTVINNMFWKIIFLGNVSSQGYIVLYVINETIKNGSRSFI